MHPCNKTNPPRRAVDDLELEKNLQRHQVHRPHQMREVFQKVQDWMRVHGYSRRDVFAVVLALQEAATNAFRHGNRSDPGKHVRVSFLVKPEEVLVCVEDQGKGFDPEIVPDPLADEYADRPGGRGLFLMRAYTTWVTFDPPGNRVTFCRLRSDIPAKEFT
jgi:serine/threonine-protein kinase RsbW